MLPAQRNKVDISKLTEEEQKLFRLYGKLPTHKNILTKMQKDRKYFDSGDYALSKAGVAPQNAVGTAIPNPENIPHATSPSVTHPSLSVSPTNSSVMSPGKESPLADSEVTAPISKSIASEGSTEAQLSVESAEESAEKEEAKEEAEEKAMESEPVEKGD